MQSTQITFHSVASDCGVITIGSLDINAAYIVSIFLLGNSDSWSILIRTINHDYITQAMPSEMADSAKLKVSDAFKRALCWTRAPPY
jgi:hypothetical protein